MAGDTVNSDIEIVNLALWRLGHVSITTFDEESAAGYLAKATYQAIKRAMLEAHPWNFLVDYATLVEDTIDADVFDYTYAYTLPANCLRVLEVENQTADAGDEWTITADRKLHTNLSGTSIRIKYLRDDVAIARYSASFIDALASRLAHDWSEKLAKSAALSERQERIADRALQTSRTMDGAEGTPRRFDAGGWLRSR